MAVERLEWQNRTSMDGLLLVRPGQPLLGSLPVNGKAAVPGDKSISHRAALLAALANGTSRIENFLVAGVTQPMLDGLQKLGVELGLEGDTLIVEGQGLFPSSSTEAESVQIYCGNSATALRLMAGVVAVWNRMAVLDGSASLRRRPMDRIVAPLVEMGVQIESTGGRAPLKIKPSIEPLKPIKHSLRVASAQVKSCLLITGLAARGTSILREPGPSRDHTEIMLREQGVTVACETDQDGENSYYLTRITPPESGSLRPIEMRVPGDFSAAAFLIVAAAITPGSKISLPAVGLNPRRTGLLDALRSMGADIQITNMATHYGELRGEIFVRYAPLRGTVVEGELVVRMIDEFPVFAVAAACAEGQTGVADAAELRHKESDRISVLAGELFKLGVAIETRPDGFIVQGGGVLRGAQVSAHGDHRLAMALAVAGLAASSPVQVHGAGFLRESFPGFADAMQLLGADVRTDLV